MTTLIVSDGNFNDPDNLIPYLERDEAIVRGVTVGMVDFSNTASYAGVGAIAAGTPVASLTNDGTQGQFATAFDAIANGMLPFSHAIAAPQLNLPATMKFGAAATKILYVLWAKIPAAGWPLVTSNGIWSLFGVLGNSGNQAQYGISLQTSLTDGSLQNVGLYVPSSGSASAGTLTISTGTLLSLIADSNLHQLAVLWDAKTTPGKQQTTLFVDQTQVAKVGPGTYDGTFNVPAIGPAVGYPGAAFQSANPYHAGLSVGRPSLWNLSNSELTVAQILADDAAAAQGYLS